MLIRRALHVKIHAWHLHDILYNVTIRQKKAAEPPPEISSLFDIFEHALKQIINEVKDYVGPEPEKNQILITICQEGLRNGINSGKFSLGEDSKHIANQTISQMRYWLSSFQGMRIKQSFKIQIQIYSKQHIQEIQAKEDAGAYKVKFKYNPIWCFPIKDGFKNFPTAFVNRCLVIATIVSYILTTDDDLFKIISRVNDKWVRPSKNAGLIILEKFHKTASLIGIPDIGPYNIKDTIKKLSGHLKCQIYIFNPNMETLLEFKWPESFRPDLPQLFLLSDNGHVDVIKKIDSFMRSLNIFGGFCLSCGNLQKSQFPHRCKMSAVCFGCNRLLLTNQMYQCRHYIDLFCSSAIATVAQKCVQTCNNCRITTLTHSCRLHHKIKCERGSKCFKCGIYVQVSGKYPTIRDIQREHKCNIKLCRKCFKHYNVEEEHICKMKVYNYPKEYSRMSFCSFESEENGTWAKPLFASLLLEDIKGESFQLHHFSVKEIVVNYPEVEVYPIPYWISNAEPLVLSSKCTTGPFGSSPNSKFTDHLEESQNPADQLLRFLISNCAFCSCICKDSWDLTYILQSCFTLGLKPIIWAKDRTIISIKVLQSLRFINSEFYFENSYKELNQMFNVFDDSYFFPNACISSNWLNYNGTIPELKYFIEFEDGTSDIEEKKKFLELKQNINWIFSEEIKKNSFRKVYILAKACLNFVTECISLQLLLINCGFKPNLLRKQFKYLHPYQNNIISKNSFMMQCYMIYSGSSYELYCVPFENHGRKHSQTSKGEREWVNYLMISNPNIVMENYLSSDSGQHNFGKHYPLPDNYIPSEKLAMFWNGCNCHGHLKNCPINEGKNEECLSFTGISFGELQKQFAKKIEKLQTFCNIRIQTIYECEWNKMRETEDVKSKLLNLPIHPGRRLIPRVSF